MSDPRTAPDTDETIVGDPLSIPIREPGPDVPRREATWLTQLPARPVIVLGVLAVVALIATAPLWWPTGGDDSEVVGDGLASADGGEDTADAETDDGSESEETLVPYTTLAAPGVVDQTTTTATDSTILQEDSSPAPGTDAAAADGGAEPSDLPILDPAALGATWVAQVSSVPTASGNQALSDGFDKVVAQMPDVVILRGSDWPGLSDTYWVLAVPGFDSGSQAVDACVAAGKTDRDDCFGKYLDPDDGTPRVCYRDDSGKLTGDC